MNITLNQFSHFSIPESLSSLQQNVPQWLSRAVNWIQASMQNRVVAYTSLIAFSVLVFIGNTLILSNIFDSEKEATTKELVMCLATFLTLQTIEVIAFTKLNRLPIHPLAILAVNVAAIAATVWLFG